ncbi:hypothetical protein F4560_007506 [Saccharothrix ecbatanensis]|uniref:Uncharacterized protein n=1 Tax=Saccharothrix ecbatanensis TaxID=1105145 RepID=A0A7W9HSQ0_9PSEU|nr:hypothetical protein [Saccharothrix ecbatanensis]
MIYIDRVAFGRRSHCPTDSGDECLRPKRRFGVI